MPFTGKATYSAGPTLPEIVEDVSDLVSINSPHETALLDALGDSSRPARSTVHEWLEDALLPNRDVVDDDSIAAPTSETTFNVANADRFRVGDQIRLAGRSEVMLVVDVALQDGQLTVERGYGATAAQALADGDEIEILGNAAIEGGDAPAARFTTRWRRTNYTQIFTSTVEVSGSELAVRQHAVSDELEYQKQQRLRELLRDLENCVINGSAPAANPEGSATVRRTMRGIVSMIASNRFAIGQQGFPDDTTLTEEQLHVALREIWRQSNAQVDLLVMGATQKRSLNQLIGSNRQFTARDEHFKDMVSVYESDFGVCRVVLSRWLPRGTVLLLDTSRIQVLPLAGRSFHYKSLAATGDREAGQLIGEYTLELRNENAHGMITGYTH
jgi:hypothetical protein